MKNLISLIVVLFLNITWGMSQDTHTFFHEEFPDIWQRAREYTLEVVEAMPEEYLDFSPTKEQMSFKGQLVHVAENIYSLTGNVILGKKGITDSINFEVNTKKDLINLLNNAFDYCSQVINTIPDDMLSEPVNFGGADMTKERVFYIMRDHCTHHRAVDIGFLRLKGIKPPRYRGW